MFLENQMKSAALALSLVSFSGSGCESRYAPLPQNAVKNAGRELNKSFSIEHPLEYKGSFRFVFVNEHPFSTAYIDSESHWYDAGELFAVSRVKLPEGITKVGGLFAGLSRSEFEEAKTIMTDPPSMVLFVHDFQTSDGKWINAKSFEEAARITKKK